jgi:hypothetical protein
MNREYLGGGNTNHNSKSGYQLLEEAFGNYRKKYDNKNFNIQKFKEEIKKKQNIEKYFEGKKGIETKFDDVYQYKQDLIKEGKELTRKYYEDFYIELNKFMDDHDLLIKLGYNNINIPVQANIVEHFKEYIDILRTLTNNIRNLNEKQIKILLTFNLINQYEAESKKYSEHIKEKVSNFVKYCDSISNLNPSNIIIILKNILYEIIFEYIYFANIGINNEKIFFYIDEYIFYKKLKDYAFFISDLNSEMVEDNLIKNIKPNNILGKGWTGIGVKRNSNIITKIIQIFRFPTIIIEFITHHYIYNSLNNNPNKNIPRPYQLIIGKYLLFYDMELINGKTLDGYLSTYEYINKTEIDKNKFIITMFKDISDILKRLQDTCHFIHADLNFGNIMFNPNNINPNNIYIIDYGGSIVKINELNLFIFKNYYKYSIRTDRIQTENYKSNKIIINPIKEILNTQNDYWKKIDLFYIIVYLIEFNETKFGDSFWGKKANDITKFINTINLNTKNLDIEKYKNSIIYVGSVKYYFLLKKIEKYALSNKNINISVNKKIIKELNDYIININYIINFLIGYDKINTPNKNLLNTNFVYSRKNIIKYYKLYSEIFEKYFKENYYVIDSSYHLHQCKIYVENILKLKNYLNAKNADIINIFEEYNIYINKLKKLINTDISFTEYYNFIKSCIDLLKKNNKNINHINSYFTKSISNLSSKLIKLKTDSTSIINDTLYKRTEVRLEHIKEHIIHNNNSNRVFRYIHGELNSILVEHIKYYTNKIYTFYKNELDEFNIQIQQVIDKIILNKKYLEDKYFIPNSLISLIKINFINLKIDYDIIYYLEKIFFLGYGKFSKYKSYMISKFMAVNKSKFKELYNVLKKDKILYNNKITNTQILNNFSHIKFKEILDTIDLQINQTRMETVN